MKEVPHYFAFILFFNLSRLFQWNARSRTVDLGDLKSLNWQIVVLIKLT
jgi:hypothetical protein